jgi:predicted membrane channel-forming protein YqfA (hemolysin III family)
MTFLEIVAQILTTMNFSAISNLRDCAVLAAINIFGLSYFSWFSLQLLAFYFPSSPGAIISSLSVIFLSAGVILWHSSSLIYRGVTAFQCNEACGWKKVETAGLLLLIWASTIPAVVLLFENRPWIQLGYSSALTVATVESLVEFLLSDFRSSVTKIQFPRRCVSLGSLSLVPMIHALAGNQNAPSPLVNQFAKMALYNALSGAFYLLQPLERMRVIQGWKPSLYILHLVITCNMVSYSRVVFETVQGTVA